MVYDLSLNHPRSDWALHRPTPVPGAQPFPRFAGKAGRLLDETGQIVLYPVRCDTETGDVERYDAPGGRFKLDPGTGRVAVVRETRPAPLTYVPREETADVPLVVENQ